MCGLIALVLLVFGGFFGFTVAENQMLSVPAMAHALLAPTQGSACASSPSGQDIDNMLAFVGDSFEPEIWMRQISSDSTRTSGVWTARSLGASASLAYLHYDCGVTQEQIDQYFGAENFKIMFSHYSSYKQTAECQAAGLKLDEFDTVFSGFNYHALLWGEQVSPTRIIGLVLVFPSSQQAKQADYARHLFPDLSTCAP